MNLANIRYAFMDFDDTLCVVTDREYHDEDYRKSMVIGDWTYYDRTGRLIGKGMREFIKKCSRIEIKLYGLTYSYSSLVRLPKLMWCDDKFGKGTFKDMITTASREYKIDVLKQFADTYDIERSQILLVDDGVDILDLAHNEGFSTYSPQQIAALYS